MPQIILYECDRCSFSIEAGQSPDLEPKRMQLVLEQTCGPDINLTGGYIYLCKHCYEGAVEEISKYFTEIK